MGVRRDLNEKLMKLRGRNETEDEKMTGSEMNGNSDNKIAMNE